MEVLWRFTVRHCSHQAATKALPQPKGLPIIGTTLDLLRAGGGPKLHLYVDTRHCSHQAATKALPQPKGLPFIGTTLDLLRAGGGPKLHLYVDARHRELGSVYRETLGPVTAVFLSDPKDMRQVFAAEGKYPVHLLPEAWLLYNKMYGSERGLFFMNGEEWLKYRHIMNKMLLYSTEPAEGLLNAYKTATNDLVDEWVQHVDKPMENVVNHMYKLSISYVLATLLGSSYPEHREQLRPSVDRLSSVVHLIFDESVKLSLLPAKMAAALRLPVWRRFVSAVHTTLASASLLVNEMLPLAASDGVLSKMAAENIPHDKTVSIVVDLILAGADTTPYTLIWALYLLARDQTLQSAVAAEPTNPVLRAVMRETLRLYPAAPFLTRALACNTELGGYLVPAGEMIIMSVYTSGRCEAYFPSPERFWPQRWMRQGGNYQAVSEPGASLPFSLGSRACVGRRVAEVQMTLTLAEILTRFRVEVKKDIEMVLMLVPVPAEPVTFHLSLRGQ